MAQERQHGSGLFSSETRNEFRLYLHDHPNSRRVSQSERCNILAWLTNPEIRPSSQQEFSRRHYVQKTFAWDETRQALVAVATDMKKDRDVITEEDIVDIVEFVHLKNGHAGWDATWKGITSSYYGILRADVIFLLKQCPVCAENPRKRPKSQTSSGLHLAEEGPSNFLSIDDLLRDSVSDIEREGMFGEQS